MVGTEYKTLHDTYTSDRKVIVAAGVTLTKQVLTDLMESGKGLFSRTIPLFEYSTIKRDMREFISLKPYDRIFSNSKVTNDIFDFMGKTPIIEPVLDSLDYFKRTDPYTYRHLLMVFMLSLFISNEMGLSKKELNDCALAAPAHDFGKICVPIEILTKSTPLTLKEKKHIEHHTIAGYALLHYYMHKNACLAGTIARDHHERLDGSGYPVGKKISDKMIEIVIVSDIYDALISPRPYRPRSFDNRTAIEEICIRAEKGEFGWNVVKALIACNRVSKKNFLHCDVSKDLRGIPPEDNLYGVIED